MPITAELTNCIVAMTLPSEWVLERKELNLEETVHYLPDYVYRNLTKSKMLKSLSLFTLCYVYARN